MLGISNHHRQSCFRGACASRPVARALLWAISFSLGWAIVPAAAQGEVIHFQMTGTITIDFQVGPLPDGIYEGAPFQADLVYDTATPDAEPNDPRRGLYFTEAGANNYLRFQAGPAVIRAHDLVLWVGNDIEKDPGLGDPLWEHKDDTFRMFDSQLIANFPIAPFHGIVFDWRDPTRAALTSDLPPVQLFPGDFDDAWFRITTGSLNARDSQFTIRAIVSDSVKVPEPTNLMLFITGTVLFFSVKMRRRPVASRSQKAKYFRALKYFHSAWSR